MAKTWANLSEAEKIEDLRRDVVRIFRLLQEYQDAIASDQSGLQSQIYDLERRLARLEKGKK